MRLFLHGAIIATAFAEKTLEEAYGPVAPVSTLVPPAERADIAALIGRTEEYYNVRTTQNCTFPLEVVILQDSTASFKDNFKQMHDVQLKLMRDALASKHPNSTFGVVSFRDKPIWSLGDRDDWCQRFETPLNADIKHVQDVYARLNSNGGGDPSENQFGAMLATAQSSTPGWAPGLATRLIVLSTDASPHFADDGLNAYGLLPFGGWFDEDQMESQCLTDYYPDPAQVKNAILMRNAYTAFLVFDPDWNNGLPVRSWKWFNNYIGQTEDFVNPLANDASNFWTILSNTITQIEEAECKPQTTQIPTSEPVSVTEAGTTQKECPELVVKFQGRPQTLHIVVDGKEFTDY